MDPRTVVCVSLAYYGGLLNTVIGKQQLKARKARIEQIINGDVTGKAVKEVIDAVQTAIMVAAIMPAIFAATSS